MEGAVMAGLDMKLNSREIDNLLKSPAVQRRLLQAAQRIAAAAGPGMEASVEVGRTRARASVITATTEARRAQATRLALIRALDAGRG
jgi:tRNA A37 threonylcarbamoyltransferase TsaD